MTGNKIYLLLIYISIILLGYIFILSVFVKSPSMLNIPSFLVLTAVGLLCTAMFWGVRFYHRIKISNRNFLIILVLATIMPRLIWILLVNSQPDSDFILFNEYAVNASKGVFTVFNPTYTVFPFKFGFPLVISVIYKIFGSNLIDAKLFSVLISVCTALQIYSISRRIFNDHVGRITGLLYSLWPAQIMLTSVLASEHIFLLFLLLSIQLFLKTIDHTGIRKNMAYPIVTGISLAITQFIRPVALILVPIFIVYLFLFKPSQECKIKSILFKCKTTVTVGVIFVLSFLILTLPLSGLIGVPIYKSSSGFNLLIGTNFASNGAYNKEDSKIITEFIYDYAKIHKEAMTRAINRILANPLSFTMLMERKYITQWGSEDYGVYWSMRKTGYSNAVGQFLINSPRLLNAASQIYYIFVLLLSIIGCLYCIKNRHYQIIIFLLLFQGLFIAHTFLEVQSRYHFPAMPAFIIMAGYGYYCAVSFREEIRRPAKKKLHFGSI